MKYISCLKLNPQPDFLSLYELINNCLTVHSYPEPPAPLHCPRGKCLHSLSLHRGSLGRLVVQDSLGCGGNRKNENIDHFPLSLNE